MRGKHPLVVVLALLLALTPSVSLSLAGQQPVELIEATREIPEHLLLDVGIVIFDPGLPEEDEDALEEKGVFAEARKSEARFIPFHLKSTLEATGHWGAVRVIPGAADNVDVRVEGEILESNGRKLNLGIRILDSTGKVWLSRNYKDTADPQAFDDEESDIDVGDPYQDLYHRIANDMLKARSKLDEARVHAIREVTRMRFAIGLAPSVFDEYLSRSKRGRYRIERLPTEDDPMMARVDRIRERDFLFVDTLNEFYAELYARMGRPYDDWREFSYEEQMALRAIRRETITKGILGGLLLFGAAASGGGSTASRAARDAAAIGGAVAITSAVSTAGEGKIHKDAIAELAGSFDAEISPVFVEIEGETLRLQGSAEAQYAEWRTLLRKIFATETGLVADPDDDAAADTSSSGS